MYNYLSYNEKDRWDTKLHFHNSHISHNVWVSSSEPGGNVPKHPAIQDDMEWTLTALCLAAALEFEKHGT